MNTRTDASGEVAHQRGLRISKLSADELVRLSGAHAHTDHLHAEDLLLINYAHVVMLLEQKIISVEEARPILKTILKLETSGWDKLISRDPRVGDLTTQVEAYIIKETGEPIGGKMHTGRSRNDLNPTMDKMLIRREVLETYQALLTLEDSFLFLTDRHLDTIMPGYTHHSQQAQPITLGHFFLGNFDVFLRDIQRIEDFLPRLNLCPMGAAALATTGFPLNRQRVAELLGFQGVLEHSYDAVSGKDFLLEHLFILAAVASDMGRIAEDLLLWNTLEFGMIVLADEYTSFSSIMPQKKNPVAVETIRAYNSIICGKMFNAFGMLKGESWSNGRETTIMLDDAAGTGTQVRDMVYLLNGIVSTMEIKKEKMAEWARKGYSTSTELADTLVRECGFSFRTAHEIVGLVVKTAIDAGLDSTQITPAMVEKGIETHLGKKMKIQEDWVQNALDPKRNVQLRKLPGGPAFEEVKRMLQHRRKLLAQKKDSLQAIQGQVSGACEKLRQKVNEIIG